MTSTERAARVTSSEYMHWAKTVHARARFNLANSGMRAYPLAHLPVTLSDIELSGPSYYGYAPLQEAIARKEGVSPDCVVAANGTSMANHLALAALVAPGDEGGGANFRAPGHPLTTAFYVAACGAVVAATIYREPLNSAAGLLILLAGVPAFLFWRVRQRGGEK